MDLEKLKDKIEEKSFNIEGQSGDKLIVVKLVDICDVIDAIANSSNDIHNVRKILSDKEIEVFSKNVFPVEQPEYEYMEGKRDGFKEGLQYCRNVIFK